MPADQRAHRPQRRRARVAAIAAAIGLSSLAAAPALLEWATTVTGEASPLEAVKGAGALALLEMEGTNLDLDPLAPTAHLDVTPYGVNIFLQLEAERDNVRRTFELLSGAGIRWARQQFPWEDIEIHARGDFTDRRNDLPVSAWDKYDHIVDSAAAHGVGLLVRLDDPPEWAFADAQASGDKGPPDDSADYARFVSAVVARYCGRVRHYQLWNEPNIYPEWGERDVDPAGYAALLKVAAAAAREACPEIVVVSAALAPTTEPGGRNMHDLVYLDALYDAGWEHDFDVLAAQGFGLWTGPSDMRASRDRTNFARVTLVRDIMVRRGDAAKPVWITEMGWNSPPPGLEAPNATAYGSTTEDQRAEYTVAAFRRMQDEWPWAGVGFVWMFRRPDWEWHSRGEGYFRLVEPDWQTTAAFEALATLASRPPQLSWGRHLPSHPALVYSGPWRDTEAVVLEGATGAEVAFPFEGTGAQLVIDPPLEALEAFVVVDGVTATVTVAAGDSQGQARSTGDVGLTTSGLAPGRHTGILRVDAGQLSLREVVVTGSGQPGRWRPLARPLAILAIGLFVAFALWAMPRRS